jgi:hypothetical protein
LKPKSSFLPKELMKMKMQFLNLTKTPFYYVDTMMTYKYSINFDTLVIYQDNNHLDKSVILKLDDDSLTLESIIYQEINKLQRTKQAK